MNGRNAVLFATHVINKVILAEFSKITDASRDIGKAILLYDDGGAGTPSSLDGYEYFLFNSNSISELNYPLVKEKNRREHVPVGRDFKYAISHMSLFNFFVQNRDYDYYWYIEYDVRFSGDWVNLFNHFDKETDFISSHLDSYEEEPDWPFWYLDHPDKSIPVIERIKSFSPILRISNQAMSFMHECLSDGWFGHTEVLFATLLYNNGFTIEDFGGTGRFCEKENINRFYTIGKHNHVGRVWPGTLRFRPPHYIYGLRKNKIYHPVKPIFDIIWIYLKSIL